LNNLDKQQYQYSVGCFSTREAQNQSHDVIYQKSDSIHKHIVPEGYLVLSKNDFGKVKSRVNVGIFNKKTNYRIGEVNSLMYWDSHQNEIRTLNTSEALKQPKRYFMIYDLNFIANFKNEKISIYDKTNEETMDIKLNRQFGYDIGEFLNRFNEDITKIPDEFRILRSIISIKTAGKAGGKISLNKQVVLNSNFQFLTGILEGYLQDNDQFIINNNINIYNISYILNLLGAQYSIRTLDSGGKHVRFKLPLFLKNSSSLPASFFRSNKYFIEDNKTVFKKDIISLVPNPANMEFNEMVNSGLIELIPLSDLVFIPIENEIMYDLTMPNIDASNFSLPGGPACKNSDGDVLAVIGITTTTAAKECITKFSTELKNNFLNLNTGDISNWGTKLDSQLGIYTATT